MNELFPCAAGVAAGVAVARLLPIRLRLPVLLALCLVIGFTASTISGEVELSFGFIPVDVAEAFGLGLLALGVSLAWDRRPALVRRPVRQR